MLTLIKRYFTLKYICKKYNIRLNLHCNKGRGSYQWTGAKTGYKIISASIHVCLWDRLLWEIFYHELGHILDAGTTKFCTGGIHKNANICAGVPVDESLLDYVVDKRGCADQYSNLLVQEASASRYAIRFLKSTGKLNKGSIHYLSLALGTYTSGVTKDKLADIDYKLNRYMKGGKL